MEDSIRFGKLKNDAEGNGIEITLDGKNCFWFISQDDGEETEVKLSLTQIKKLAKFLNYWSGTNE